MTISLKSRQELAQLRASGQLVAQTFEILRPYIQPGVTTAELDALAEDYIRSHGAEPVYKGYAPRGAPPFPGTICASINDVVCHGIPSRKARLREGDIIGVDIGVRLNGWVGDACMTYTVGKVDVPTQKLIGVAERCLLLGVEQARLGNTLGDIGAAIQQHAEGNGFSIVREYTGHGLGRKLHEEPTVLHYGTPRSGRRLMKGMVFTIEPMINAGHAETTLDRDGWTVRTADGKRSAQFEHTIAITDDGPLVLTLP